MTSLYRLEDRLAADLPCTAVIHYICRPKFAHELWVDMIPRYWHSLLEYGGLDAKARGLKMMTEYVVEMSEEARLKRFLSWLLDARWFPEIDDSIEKMKNENRAALRRLRSILKRMETFARQYPDGRLDRGLVEWRSQEQILAGIARSTIRRSPVMQITSQSKAERTAALHLLCASLVIAKLWPGESVYRKMTRFLADPSTLPFDTAQAGCDLPRRPLHTTEKALQIMVRRMRRDMKAGRSALRDDFAMLGWVYGDYCWLSLGKPGYGDSEKQMLLSLVAQDRNARQVEGLVLTGK